MKKKFLIVFLSALMVVITPAIASATDKTRDEALAWVQSQVGKSFGSGECVDFIKSYYEYLGVSPAKGNGRDYATNALPDGWQRLQGAAPEPGDILVYSGSSSNPYGHVGIYESDYCHYNQNVSGTRAVVKCTWHYTKYAPYWGVIRPNFADIHTPTPKPKREGLELGDSGNDVKKLQETLNGMTGTSLNADGSYGSNTENAVKEYQQKKGLTVDGWYGPNTKAALEDEVRTMQNMLNAVTGTALNADGWYGPNTKKAVIAYQQKKGLNADGWYGPKTKAALEADYNDLTSPSSPTPTHAPATMPSESDKSETFKEPATGGDTSEITAPASFHFAKKTSYTQGQFTDVPASQWYTDNVASAFETGLMVGKSDTTFSPFADVTIAEAITMAARVHSIYTTGTENFARSDTWYQPYLDYAYQNGIINEGYYNCDVTQKANRAQFAEIFANSLPGEALPAINNIADNAIPDVKTGSQYADYVYKLYRAGILAGGDASGTFSPDTYITRAEAASIVSRLGDTDFRVSFSLN